MTALIGVDLRARAVLAVGGGPVSARRVAAFLADGAHVRVVAESVCEDLAELVRAGSIRWDARVVEESDLDGVWLVHTATGDRDVDAQVARWAQEARVFCILAGDAAVGSARMPARSRHGDLELAVLSADCPDPARVARVRDGAAAVLGQWLDSGGADLRRGRPTAGGGAANQGTAVGRVFLVGGGPGDPDLLTVRARRALACADVVITDRLGPVSVLSRLPGDVEIIDVGKVAGHHPVPQSQINDLLIEHAQLGRTVVRLKGGDPYVLGRGGEEALACAAAGVPVEVVPGITSAVAVPAAAGIPVTHRGVATAFLVITGHDGLTPAAATAVRDGSATVVVLMGVSTLAEITGAALAAGADPGTPLTLIEQGTLPTQRVTRSTLATALADCCRVGVLAPAVIVIGKVAALDVTATALAGSGDRSDG